MLNQELDSKSSIHVKISGFASSCKWGLVFAILSWWEIPGLCIKRLHGNYLGGMKETMLCSNVIYLRSCNGMMEILPFTPFDSCIILKEQIFQRKCLSSRIISINPLKSDVPIFEIGGSLREHQHNLNPPMLEVVLIRKLLWGFTYDVEQ